MILSNFRFLRFAQKSHFQAVKFSFDMFLTDRPTNLVLEAPFWSSEIILLIFKLCLSVKKKCQKIVKNPFTEEFQHRAGEIILSHFIL